MGRPEFSELIGVQGFKRQVYWSATFPNADLPNGQTEEVFFTADDGDIHFGQVMGLYVPGGAGAGTVEIKLGLYGVWNKIYGHFQGTAAAGIQLVGGVMIAGTAIHPTSQDAILAQVRAMQVTFNRSYWITLINNTGRTLLVDECFLDLITIREKVQT